ncbi:hypothetical protein Tco_0265239 [Tanacetum coccineum]
MAGVDINTLTVEQYLSLSRENQAPGVILLRDGCVLSRSLRTQLERGHKSEWKGDDHLYQAWERYNDLLYKCLTHDINSHQKVNIFYKGLSTMNRQLLDYRGTPSQDENQIRSSHRNSKPMADHS